MDDKKILTWICTQNDCQFGRVIDTVPDLLKHSQNKHKLIKYEKFRDIIITHFDDSTFSKLHNEQHYLKIIGIVQEFINQIKQNLTIFENTFKDKFNEIYEELYPRNFIINVTQQILDEKEINQDILNKYIDCYFNQFEINHQIQNKLLQLENQITNFCQTQYVDYTILFQKQLHLRKPAIILQEPILNQQIQENQIINPYEFNVGQSSSELQFEQNNRIATSINKKCIAFYSGEQLQTKVLIQVRLSILNEDDYIFSIGVVNNQYNLDDYDGCYLLTQTGKLLKEQEIQQSKLIVQDKSIIKVRYSKKKHNKKLFFQVDNNLNDKLTLDRELDEFSFIIIMKNVQVQLL